MARQAGNDEDWADKAGQLSLAFGSAAARLVNAVLHQAFVAVARPKAFRKNIFNSKASRTPERLRLLNHLPSREQFSVMRKRYEFQAMSHEVSGHNARPETAQAARAAAGAKARLPFPQP